MSTQPSGEVVALPTRGQADATVRRTVKALITGRDMKVEELAELVGMNRVTMYRRLKTHGPAFTAGEVADIARALHVPITDLFEGIGGRFTPDPDDEGNQQPFDYRSELADHDGPTCYAKVLPFTPREHRLIGQSA